MNKLFSAVLRPNGIFRSSAALGLITAAGYVGFLIRDIILVRQLGLGDKTDVFFVAMAIPMLCVICIGMPIGDSSVSLFVTKRASSTAERVALLQDTLGHSLILLSGVASVIFIVAPWLLEIMLQHASSGDLARACSFTSWMALIILFSAWTVVGNAMLNSLGKFREAALGQLFAPITTVILLFFAPDEYLLAFCIAGMLLGVLGNIFFVYYILHVNSFPLVPRFSSISSTFGIQKLYWGMLIISLHSAIAMPMNYAFASSVELGSLSGWAIISKIMTLTSGLIGILVSSIILPRMALKSLINKLDEYKTYSQMGYVGTISFWWAAVLTTVGFVLIDPMLLGAFGHQLDETITAEFIDVIRVGLLQIPIVIVAAVINKMAVLKGATRYVLWATLTGILGNFICNWFLVPRFGLLGVAIGACLGVALSLLIVAFRVRRLTGFSRRTAALVLLSWLAMVAVCVGTQSNSAVIFCMGLIISGIMGRRLWLQLQKN